MSYQIRGITDGLIEEKGDRLILVEESGWQEKWDKLVYEAVFGEEKRKARYIIWEAAQSVGARASSINDLYMARGRDELPHDFTVPAMNLRGMAYDMARAVFSKAVELEVGALICELARSEMGYTDQPPEEYATVVIAAAVREGFRGPLFIQGDHFQTKEAAPGVPKEGEVEAVSSLIKEAVNAGFYNIDIDTSTLVDLEKASEDLQQSSNIEHSVKFAKLVRSIEPEGVTISLGGEIGHIGGKNSTIDEFEAYMRGFNDNLPEGMVGMSKISVQTGTSHGGVVMEDGSLASVDVDFNVLSSISKIGREKYKIGGAVQHGASTLPDEFFSQFPKSEAIEVHLATGFQNIMIDHEAFPEELRQRMYKWLDENKQDERKEGQTDEQFHYKLRKKAWGEFKKECWDIEKDRKEKIREALKERFEFMYRQLNVVGTKETVRDVVKAPEIHKTIEDFGRGKEIKQVKGLAD